MACLFYSRRKVSYFEKGSYATSIFFIANLGISKGNTLICPRDHQYNCTTHDTHAYSLHPHPLYVIRNGTTKDDIFENYGLVIICQETVVQWLIKIGSKCDYAINNYYVGSNEKKDMIWYIWQFIDSYLLLKWCIFIWIQITAQDSYQYKR